MELKSVILAVILAIASGLTSAYRQLSEGSPFSAGPLFYLKQNDSTPSSILSWDTVETPSRFSTLSFTVEHKHDGNWYIPAMHDKHSVGWNRTFAQGFLNSPVACNLRFMGLGLEATLKNFMKGGSGFITVHFKTGRGNAGGRHFWYGFDKNETNKLYCYYETNKNYGSEFQDKPKTLGIVIYCPITMDFEVGEFNYRNVLSTGYFCRVLSEHISEVDITLRSSDFVLPPAGQEILPEGSTQEIKSSIVTAPAAARLRYLHQAEGSDFRVNAVCTVQTFRNNQTGPMLYMFAAYYLEVGWSVIIYDRFGMHREYLSDLLRHPGLHYHPYTAFQLAIPSKYNDAYAAKQGWSMKYFYKMEKNWGFSGDGEADTADQDQDKTKTYDMCRIEYAHLNMILYIDADEIFYCPQAASSLEAQRRYQQDIMAEFSALGVEEMRFVRLPYSGIAPADFPRENASRSETDFTANTVACMQNAYKTKDLVTMFQCWSSASAMDNFPKSADFAGKCPFHYNHWSCDGGRSGGRDAGFGIPRCRCKVSLDMSNFFEFKPNLRRCHLLHFNDNKYRFQSRRDGMKFDKGDIFSYCPVVAMLQANASSTSSTISSSSSSGTLISGGRLDHSVGGVGGGLGVGGGGGHHPRRKHHGAGQHLRASPRANQAADSEAGRLGTAGHVGHGGGLLLQTLTIHE